MALYLILRKHYTYEFHSIPVNRKITTINFRVRDITTESEIFIDDIYVYEDEVGNIDSDLFTFLTSYSGSDYYVSKNVDTWQNAKAICEQNGGHLITIANEDENAIGIQAANMYDLGRIWIGFTDEETEGEWKWITGEPVTYTNWYEGQPDNNGGDEHYAILFGDSHSTNGEWGDNRNAGSNDRGRYFVLEVPCSNREKGLVAHYPFNENLNDETGNGHDGEMHGTMDFTTDRFGNPNQALYLDGVDSYVDIGDIDLEGSFSISVWFKNEDAFRTKQAILDKAWDWRIVGEDGNDENFLNGQGIDFSIFNGTQRTGIGYESSSVDEWIHLVAVYDINSMTSSLYVNNILFETMDAIPREYNDNSIKIGSKYTTIAHSFFKGTIDDVHLYNSAISGNVVDSLYHVNGWNLNRITEVDHYKISTFKLEQNYPNPFNPVTTIRYSVPAITSVTIDVFNTIGQHIKTLLNKLHSQGEYTVRFNGRDLPSGIYYYRIQAGEFTQVKKMILLK